MNINELKDKISQANSAYRSGTPIMEDQEFDDLLERLEAQVSKEEYDAFRDTLHEAKGKVKHPYVLGSLNKIKAEEPQNVLKFLKTLGNEVNVSAKVDGISCRLHYENGNLVQASTRGDGSFGELITDKVLYVKGVPQSIPENETTDIRGELVICNDDFEDLDGYANPRNAVAGIMNKKEWDKDEVSHVSFIAYTILGSKYTKKEQFSWLMKSNNFIVAANADVDVLGFEDPVKWLFNKASEQHAYQTDGLVICSSSYRNEEKYRPDNCMAFKINQQIAETTVIDVTFYGPTKSGVFCPVAVLEPVELGGAMISKCSLHNVDIVKKLGVKYGSRVKIKRSGDVIPHLVEVVSTPADAVDIEFPTECPECGTPLVLDGVNWRCPNQNCSCKVLHQAVNFIKSLGVKSASEATFKKFGIEDIPGIIAFKADPRKKSEQKLADELKMKVFTRSKQELLAAMSFDSLGETLINKIVDFYGYDNIEAGKPYVGLPTGVGELTLEKFKESIVENLKLVNMLINDPRYSCSKSSQNTSRVEIKPKNNMSVCFTGKLDTMSRSEASKKAEAAGFEVKGGVTKGLTFLVTNTPNSGSSKNKKAKELGTKVITEAEFIAMLNEPTAENDINDL